MTIKAPYNAVAAYCDDNLTPGFYAGVRDFSATDNPSFFRDVVFGASDRVTDRDYLIFDEIRDETDLFMPPTVCACDDFEYIPTSDGWNREFINLPYHQLGAKIGCDFRAQIGPGQAIWDGDSLGSAVDEEVAKKINKLDRAFNRKEAFWAAKMATHQHVIISGKGQESYSVDFKRDSILSDILQGESQWGKSKSDPFSDIGRMDSIMFEMTGASTSVVVANTKTMNKIMAGDEYKDCLKSCNPSIFFNSEIIESMKLGPRRVQDAKYRFSTTNGGMRIEFWEVNERMSFKDPSTGAVIKIDLLEDGKVIGFDLSGSSVSYNGRFYYGGIVNHNAGPNRKRARFSQSNVSKSGKCIEMTTESSFLPVPWNQNASWELTVC